MIKYLFCTVLYLITCTVFADKLPKPFSANFHGSKHLFDDVYIGDADAVITLSRQGNYFKYSMRSKVSALLFYRNEVYDCSVMVVRDGDIYPLEHMHTEINNNNNSHTTFDWATRIAQVQFGNGNNKTAKNIPVPTWDPMAIQVKVMFDILNEKLKKEKIYKLIENGDLSDISMRMASEKTVTIKQGSFNTINVKRTLQGQSDELWFSKEYALIPVKMRISDVVVELVSDLATVGTTIFEATNSVPENIPHC